MRFGSFAELNAWLEKRCRALWAELPYPDVTGLDVTGCAGTGTTPPDGDAKHLRRLR